MCVLEQNGVRKLSIVIKPQNKNKILDCLVIAKYKSQKKIPQEFPSIFKLIFIPMHLLGRCPTKLKSHNFPLVTVHCTGPAVTQFRGLYVSNLLWPAYFKTTAP